MTITQELLPDVVVEYSRGTIDFVTGTVRDRNGNNLTMGVELAITVDGDDAVHAWLAAGWTGAASAERGVATTAPVTLDTAGYPSDRYGVYVRLDNFPAHPIFRIGTLVLTD